MKIMQPILAGLAVTLTLLVSNKSQHGADLYTEKAIVIPASEVDLDLIGIKKNLITKTTDDVQTLSIEEFLANYEN
ncbi:hypothetical protein [Sphingobacterium pedocola]|uniref:Uncharacterized protein n=1 Tax=Sphingobacterium pedocola TaxID=2082722 RepID=A0ABR9TAB0_9SPHI|nr:hypothetical protein [Sphingobacterium pedocola]MBE8722029.1 hypothetical protein [Sphingobacterium pedocola]